jgi:hypothetical protein
MDVTSCKYSGPETHRPGEGGRKSKRGVGLGLECVCNRACSQHERVRELAPTRAPNNSITLTTPDEQARAVLHCILLLPSLEGHNRLYVTPLHDYT